ncbi:hypothetical protein [Ostreiculturibacter nitratireducens]|uniref:hypothetical protein n=1 Tax=Ostreiculturibacter nitratireducens TaxID=3075226 RepID=UPI0031B5BBA8
MAEVSGAEPAGRNRTQGLVAGLSQGRLVIWLIALLVLATAILNAVKFSGHFHDDAFISLRYARHLAELGELAWNPGEPVEGYTNPLHVVMSAALIRIGFDGMAAVHLINGAAVLALWALVWALTSGLPTAARLAGLSAAVCTPVLAWAWGGLEAVPAAAFVAGGFLAAIRATGPRDRLALSALASFLFGLAYLTRPDALMMNLATGIAVLAVSGLPLGRRMLHFVTLGSISGLMLLLHVAVRLTVYGLWLPLTFYAKVGVDPLERLEAGAIYLGLGMIELPAIALVIALALALRGGTAEPEHDGARRLARMSMFTLALFLAYIVWSGGDHMYFARILVPTVPVLALATAANIARLPRPALGATALLLAVLGAGQAAVRPFAAADDAAAIGAVVGKYLAANYPPGTTIALATAGSTPYFADMHRYIDTLGLNDPVIALRDPVPILTEFQKSPGHGKGDGAYVLSRKPDVIILGLAAGPLGPDPVFLTDAELAANPEFARCYEERKVELEPPFDVPLDAPSIRKPISFIRHERVC